MAINLAKMTDKGVIANYWSIEVLDLVKQLQYNDTSIVNINYSVSGYVNRTAKENGSKPLQELSYSCVGDPNDANLIVYPSIAINYKKGILSTNFSGFDTIMSPGYSITLLELCNQLIGYAYMDCKLKDFGEGVDC